MLLSSDDVERSWKTIMTSETTRTRIDADGITWERLENGVWVFDEIKVVERLNHE